jgi:hypothetical protein
MEMSFCKLAKPQKASGCAFRVGRPLLPASGDDEHSDRGRREEERNAGRQAGAGQHVQEPMAGIPGGRPRRNRASGSG